MSVDSFTDALVGRDPVLPITAIAYSEVRFGIEVPVNEMHPTGWHCRLSLESEDGARADMRATLLATPTAITANHRKVRITNGPLELIISGAAGVRLQLAVPEEGSVEVLIETAQFWRLLQSKCESFTLSVELENCETATRRFKLGEPPTGPEAVERLFRGALAVDSLASKIGFRIRDEQVYVEELSRFAENLDALAYGCCLSRYPTDFVAGSVVRPPADSLGLRRHLRRAEAVTESERPGSGA